MKSLTSHNDLIKWLELNFSHEVFSPGFKRVKESFEFFKEKFQSKKIKIITVAGTNGKGEVSHRVYQILKSENFNVAMWTSPHIISPVERFIFSDGPLAPEKLKTNFIQCQQLLNENSIKLSFYEFLFYCFCFEVLQREVDLVVLEVGLGGRLDAVNVFNPDVTCITSISRDHTEILGDTLEKILVEKLGITRPNTPLITSLELQKLRNKTRDYCEKGNIPWFDLYKSFQEKTKSKDFSYSELNHNTALHVVTEFTKKFNIKINETKYSNPKIFKNLGKGRWEKVTIGDCSFIFIGAHNTDGARKLTSCAVYENLGVSSCDEPSKDCNSLKRDFNIWVGLSDRSYDDCLSMVGSFLTISGRNKLSLFQFKHPRALGHEKFNGLLSDFDHQICCAQDIEDELKLKELFSGTILVTGSYYFIGEVQKALIRLYPSLANKLLP